MELFCFASLNYVSHNANAVRAVLACAPPESLIVAWRSGSAPSYGHSCTYGDLYYLVTHFAYGTQQGTFS